MDLQSLNLFDAILGGAVIISALVGIARGFLREVLSLVAWFVALWIAFTFADLLSQQFVRQFIDDEHIAYIASFGLLFLITLFSIGLLNLLISSIFKATGLGGFDRLLGMFFGLARGFLIGAVIVFFARLYPGIEKFDSWRESKLVPGFSNIANWGIARIPENVRAYADSWMNPKDVLILPNSSTQPHSSSDSSALSLTSLQDNQPTRPQINAAQRQQQSAQANAIADMVEVNHPIVLESINNSLEGNVNIQNTVEVPDDVPPLQLESLQ